MMSLINNAVVTINGGSSGIKFALYEVEVSESLKPVFYGEMEFIGPRANKINFTENVTKKKNSVSMEASDPGDAIHLLMDWLVKQEGFNAVTAIGHRVVHGMKYTEPQLITPELVDALRSICEYDPEHLGTIKLIETFALRFPAIQQVACFDTSFHTSMPAVAKILPIPRRFGAKGIHRYGFHGLSYAYLMEQLEQIAGRETAQGKIILAHLGNGASLAAVKAGKSIDTSMGFTPTSGLPMSTRTGDLDPGVASYIMRSENLSPEQFSRMVNHESGLFGISGTSSDMRELLKSESTDSRAAEAVELFCYQTKKWIGSFAAALGGLDTLVFSGGIGEHSPEIRSRICAGLSFLGIELDETKNINNDAIISAAGTKVCIRVIHTNEEFMISKLTCKVLNFIVGK